MTLERCGPVVLVGAGKMGGALLEGWLARGLPAGQVYVQDPAPPEECAAIISSNAIVLNKPLNDIPDPVLVLLAVKPQVMDQVLDSVKGLVRPGTAFLSIAAGRTVESLAQRLGADTAVIRTIPNTPAAIGRGITVAFAGDNVSDAQRKLATDLLTAVGDVVWVDDEGLIDAATAVSGSGPAYVFYLVECLAQAGVAAGLDKDAAARLARVTIEGAGELLHQSALAPETLRKNVTSPGGTTQAALEVLSRDGGLPDIMRDAVLAALKRARELAQ